MLTGYLNLDTLIQEAGLTVPTVGKKRRFLLVGTHAHQTTGYSKVTYNIIQELAKLGTLDLFHFGFQRFVQPPPEYRTYPAGVDVFDPVEAERTKAAEQEMGFGFSQLPDYVRKVKPDVILIYNDAGVICRFLDKLTEKLTEAERKQYKMIIYLDQVYVIQRPELLGRIEKDADAYFAFTQYWKQMLEKQGVKKPIYVLRHGFDASQFVIKDRVAMRKKHGIPENLFLFLNLNRNTPRKRYDIVVTAFAELVARHPTKPLALLAVCDGGETGGFPIQEIYLRELERLGVPIQFHAQKLMITKSALTYTDELINELYSLSDVGITAAEGEGFGLCQFEAMGVGIPQVVPWIGGFRDFCEHGKNCQTVKPKYRSYLALGQSSVGGMAELVDAHDLMLAAEEYVMDSDMRASHGVKARETVLQYSWTKEVAGLERVIQTI
ncbi:MAG: glycosyltransferase [Actinobacteria bacterium]|nr:glycosyltransferase [Actinomycetota bacterium]